MAGLGVDREESYRFYFENMPAMVHSTNTDAQFVNVSNVWLEKTGWSRDEVVGRKIQDFAPPGFAAFFTQLAGQLETDGFYHASYDILRKDGSSIQLRASSVIVNSPVSAKPVSLTISQDISEERRLMGEIQKQQAALITAARMASLGEMASGIAHEINNPLTIIHGKASQIRRFLTKASLNLPQIEEMTDVIEKTSMRIAAITRSLRAFAREGSESRPTRVPLVSIIDETLLLCQAMFRNHQIELRVSEIPPDLKFECRPADMSQALLNLLKNAFEAVSAKTDFSESDPGPRIQIDLEQNFDRTRLLIRNNGGLIPDEIRDRIMHPFFTTKVVGNGSGLGLSVAKGLIESQGGHLFLDETMSETTFVVELPNDQITC